jgi:hypothetical protein
MEIQHVPDAVYSGVDGIGIGTSLHYFNTTSKQMGALKPDYIRKVLAARNEAAASIRGRAARLLAQLDYMYFEGSLERDDESDRWELWQAVKQNDTTTMQRLLYKYDAQPIHEGEHKLLDKARRVLAAARPLLAERIEGTKWESFRNELTQLVESENVVDLRALFQRFTKNAPSTRTAGAIEPETKCGPLALCQPLADRIIAVANFVSDNFSEIPEVISIFH